MLKGKTIIAERLRQLRGTSSLREMADAVGIKYSAWARYEAGGSLPGADILARICCVHACSADWLLGLPKAAAQTAAHSAAHSAAQAAAQTAAESAAHSAAQTAAQSAAPGSLPACAKCPFKEKVKAFEALARKPPGGH